MPWKNKGFEVCRTNPPFSGAYRRRGETKIGKTKKKDSRKKMKRTNDFKYELENAASSNVKSSSEGKTEGLRCAGLKFRKTEGA